MKSGEVQDAFKGSDAKMLLVSGFVLIFTVRHWFRILYQFCLNHQAFPGMAHKPWQRWVAGNVRRQYIPVVSPLHRVLGAFIAG